MPKKIEKIVVHCSDSEFGCATMIDKWHREKGWAGIGYGAVICNGFWNAEMYRAGHIWQFADGAVEAGRPFNDDTVIDGDELEAQVFGWNDRTVGICLIGKSGAFTNKQLLSLNYLLAQYLLPAFHLKADAVVGHYELDSKKPLCPGLDMEKFRSNLASNLILQPQP